MNGPPVIVLFNRTLQRSHAFTLLSFGTISAIGVSCAAEEYILKRIVGFNHYWFLAFAELLTFAVCTYLVVYAQQYYHHQQVFSLKDLRAPLHLYVASATLIGVYTSLGKIAYKFINYATGTVLKSGKLIPVMVLSAVWLKRTYHFLDYVACVLLVLASCAFALGEHETNKLRANDDDGGGSGALVNDPNLYAFGFFLSFVCVCVGAIQSNVVDRALRDYDATVSENMLMTNSIGALLVLVVVLVKEPDAFAFFCDPWYFSLLFVRSVVFWLGAWLYTTLVKHFGAVAAVAVTTVRKVLTVISSFIFFSSDKPFGFTYFIALLLFFGACSCEFAKTKFTITTANNNTKDSKQKELEMARKDSDVEKVNVADINDD